MTLPKLTPEQQNVVHYLESTTENVFLTGRAGTGKTTVLREFQKRTRKKVAVCAPTGIAALNASGATIHNLLGLGATQPADAHIDIYQVRSRRKILQEIDTLIVDEVSMVSSDLLDAMDRTLQGIRQNHESFGGIQMVFFGDIYQLPPVVSKEDMKYFRREGYKSEWFFDAHVWEYSEFKTFSLQKVHRQSNEEFITLLNGVRDGSIDWRGLDALNDIAAANIATDKSILLGSRRLIVEDHNKNNLKKLQGKRHTYSARVNTGFGRLEPAERLITLKPGAKIMMLSNDRADRWVNGTQGTVKDCSEGIIQVDLDDGTSHMVERHAWVAAGTPPEMYQEAPKYHQFPIKLAWAVTIHKAQGLSLPEINIDLGSGAFSPGQTYVALSRVQTPEGLHIKTPLRMTDIQVDPNVKRFFETMAK